MLTVTQTAVDRMERFYNLYTNGEAEKTFLPDIAAYVKEEEFPFRTMEICIREGNGEETVTRIDTDSEKAGSIQTKAKNQKAWRIYLVIAQMYRAVKAEQGRFRGQEAGDAWYFTDEQYPIGTYMVPFSVLSLVMDAVEGKWGAKEIVKIDRVQKKTADKASSGEEQEDAEEDDDEGLAGYQEEEDPDDEDGDQDEDEAEEEGEEEDEEV